MKRSEMVKKLNDLIIEHMNCRGECCNTDEEMYSTILAKLEQLGMKPPERVFWNRRPDGALLPSPKNGNMINEWDKE